MALAQVAPSRDGGIAKSYYRFRRARCGRSPRWGATALRPSRLPLPQLVRTSGLSVVPSCVSVFLDSCYVTGVTKRRMPNAAVVRSNGWCLDPSARPCSDRPRTLGGLPKYTEPPSPKVEYAHFKRLRF